MPLLFAATLADKVCAMTGMYGLIIFFHELFSSSNHHSHRSKLLLGVHSTSLQYSIAFKGEWLVVLFLRVMENRYFLISESQIQSPHYIVQLVYNSWELV